MPTHYRESPTAPFGFASSSNERTSSEVTILPTLSSGNPVLESREIAA